MTTKQSYTMKDRLYGGTYGNLSVDCLEFDVEKLEMKPEDAVELGYLPVGTNIREVKIFNEDIGAGKTIQLFVQDSKRVNHKLSEVIDVSSAAFTLVDGIDFYVGDDGPYLLFAVVDPVSGKEQTYAKELDEVSKTTKEKPDLTSFSVVFSSNTLTVGNVATAYAVAPVPPKASLHGVTWGSSDEHKATVGDNGDVVAVAAGTVTITATVGTVTAHADITIIAP